jgi:hypothetical protein
MPTDELMYWVSWGPPPRPGTPQGIVVSGVGTGPIIWELDRPEWEHDPPGAYSMISRAGTPTPTPPERLEPSQPVQAIDRPTAERIAAQLGLTLPPETELWEILRAGMAKQDAQRWQASLLRAYGRNHSSLGMRPIRAESRDPEGRQTTFYASYGTDQATEPNGVAIVQPWWDYVRAVAWSPKRNRWVYAPTTVHSFLLSPYNSMRKEVIDRATAEQISLRVNGVPLPTDEEVTRICDAAIAKKPRLAQPPT